jgi:hypothetical protein
MRWLAARDALLQNATTTLRAGRSASREGRERLIGMTLDQNDAQEQGNRFTVSGVWILTLVAFASSAPRAPS